MRSSSRPAVSALFLAQVFEQLPARLRRRLEQEPELAEGWTWKEGSVEAGADATVGLRSSVVAAPGDVSCTCLLAPRCLHIAAVLRVLPVSTDLEAPVVSSPAAESADPADEVVALDARQAEAVAEMWRACVAVLDSGAGAAGLVAEGDLLRAIHSCRVVGLHRLSAGGLRLVGRIRALRAERPEFRLELLAADFHEVLLTCRSLKAARVDPEWVGTARREYRPVGSLKLAGILTEPIAATGFAGAVTYFVDSQRRIWSLSDIAPGDATRCQAAYRAAAAIGDVSLPHFLIGRRSLFVQRATTSRDGRLGSGQSVGAVMSGPSHWNAPPIADIFSTPLRAQLDAAWASVDRPVGFDLLFFRGKVVGARENALLVETAEGLLGCFAPSDHAALAYRDNLRLIGSVPDLEVMAVGRIQFTHPASVSLLAVSIASAALPEEWLERVNLGLDVLTRGHLPSATAARPSGELPLATSQATMPLDAIRRRLLQVVMGGSSTISPVAWSGIERDEATLAQAQLTTGAKVLAAVRTCGAGDRPRSERRDRLARAWLAASTYERSATAYVQRLTWL